MADSDKTDNGKTVLRDSNNSAVEQWNLGNKWILNHGTNF